MKKAEMKIITYKRIIILYNVIQLGITHITNRNIYISDTYNIIWYYLKGDLVMKLVIVIVSNKDLTNVLSSTVEEGYFSTKISTQGMFLENGQTTVLFGVKDEEVEKLFEIIEQNVTKRVVRHVGVDSTLQGSLLKKPVDVEEYGAVAFVLDVDQFRKL